MKKSRILLWIATVCLLAVLIPCTVFAVSNGWNENADGSWSYYYGGWYKNTVKNIDGAYYGFDANGIMITNKWHKDAGYWYYSGADGKCYQNGVYQIGSAYYGFGWNGRMYDDTRFSLYDRYKGDLSYCAKAGGRLYVNEWYVVDDTRWYYGDGGVGAEDFVKIDGVWYYFNYGQMAADELVYSDKYQAFYYISKDGKSSVQAPRTGWLQAGEHYYYFHDGEKYKHGVYNIGGKNYGFSFDGVLYQDEPFSVYHFDGLMSYVYSYYRAKPDGSLYEEQWYQEGHEWYYYGKGGACRDGFAEVKGVRYFFSEGRMVVNDLVYSKGTYYLVDATGTSFKEIARDGWIPAGEKYYYMKDGKLYKYGIYNIDGKHYGFDNDGVMFSDTAFVIDGFNEQYELTRGYYRARKDGSVYENSWYQADDGDWYYYGASGAGFDDFVQIKGVWYFFREGRMVTNAAVYSSKYKGCYVISEDGTSSAKVAETGWICVGDKYYYFNGEEGQEMFCDCIVTINSKHYAFDSDGAMVTGWLQFDDSWYYFESSGAMVTGWLQIGNTWYYLRSSGVMATGWLQIGNTWYYLGSSGAMVTGWKQIENAWYYFGSSGAMVTGWLQQGNDWYYLKGNGEMVTGACVIGTRTYQFASNGVWIP